MKTLTTTDEVYALLHAPAAAAAPGAAITTGLLWIFLDSLHNADFSIHTLDEFSMQLARAGFAASGEQHTFGKGWTVLQARKREGA